MSDAEMSDAEMTREIAFTVNGQPAALAVEERFSLADMLRYRLGLTGTHLGCEHGVCGACTVMVNGHAVRACLMLAVQVDGAAVTTVEGLADDDGRLSRLQQAFSDHHGLQCGFYAGILMTLTEFLADHPAPAETSCGKLSGNICRCTGYQGIVDAVMDVLASPPPAERALMPGKVFVGQSVQRLETRICCAGAANSSMIWRCPACWRRPLCAAPSPMPALARSTPPPPPPCPEWWRF